MYQRFKLADVGKIYEATQSIKDSWPGLQSNNNLVQVLQPDSSDTESFNLLEQIVYPDGYHGKSVLQLQLTSLPASKENELLEKKIIVTGLNSVQCL